MAKKKQESPPDIISTVAVDQVVKLTWIDGERVVLPACTSKNGGLWVCVTHQQAFANQFQKDTHITYPEGRRHTLAWMCSEHGVEVP